MKPVGMLIALAIEKEFEGGNSMSTINEVVMVSACRTPIGDFLGSLKSVRANELSRITAAEAIKRAGIEPGMIDELVMGMCLHHGNGSLPPGR